MGQRKEDSGDFGAAGSDTSLETGAGRLDESGERRKRMLKWNYKPCSGNAKQCLVAYTDKHNRTYVVNGWSGNGKTMFNGYAWADFPPADINKNRQDWKSVYFGDEEPAPGIYLLLICESQRHYRCSYQWHDPDKSVFKAGTEVIAWCTIKPPGKKGA